jgi:hypothetical protein
MAGGTKISILSLSASLLLTSLATTTGLVSTVWAQAPSPSLPAKPQPSQPITRGQAPAPAKPGTPVDSLKEIFERLFTCWKPPAASVATPMDITVLVSFNRSGAIMGRPRITFESPKATDSDRLAYRVAVMEALQRCSPMPFTETMAGAVAGRPLAVQFRTHFEHQEKRAWLSPKIL